MAASIHVPYLLLLLLTSCLHGGFSKGLIFTTTPGLSLSGHDYQPAVTTASRSLCALICHRVADAGCNAAQYDELTGRCELKRHMYLPLTLPAPATTYYMYYTPPGFKLVGHELTSLSFGLTPLKANISLYRGAEESCVQHKDCVGFMYREMETGEQKFTAKFFIRPSFSTPYQPGAVQMSAYIIPEMDDFPRRQDNKKCPAGDDLSGPANGAGHRACMLSCHRRAECVAYTWYRDTGKCSLKSSCGTLKERSAAFTGKK